MAWRFHFPPRKYDFKVFVIRKRLRLLHENSVLPSNTQCSSLMWEIWENQEQFTVKMLQKLNTNTNKCILDTIPMQVYIICKKKLSI